MQIFMGRTRRSWLIAALMATALSSAWGQGAKTPGDTPKPDELEPGVNTSVTPPVAAPTPAPAKPRAATAPVVTAPSSSSQPSASMTSSAAIRVPAQSPGIAGAAKPAGGTGKSSDRIELDSTQITGNRELPKVLYIVPWKRSDLGDLEGKPVNSLLDEVLTPVDRDVFKRQNRYYDALKPDAAGQRSGAAESGEKR
jgi:hypothetical protein